METVCIFGLGYVGREVASLASDRGFQVIGVDKDPSVINSIKRGDLLNDVSFEVVTTNDYEVAANSDIIIEAVPTPVNGSKMIDTSALEAVTEIVTDLKYENPPLYIIESTIPPGTTSDVVVSKLEQFEMKVGEDIHVAHVPERINPGTGGWALAEIPRVVGAVSEKGLHRATNFYSYLIDAEIHPVESPEIAEASKLVENTYRDVNIAFVNEIALALEHLNIDVSDVLDAADSKPFGFERFYPGIGVGGHCIPIDPYFLIRMSSSEGFNNRFLKNAREINDRMPIHVAQNTIKQLNKAEILPNGSRVVLLGAAFKPNVADTRNSPYYDLKSELEDYGVTAETYDPNLPELSSVDSPYVSADAVVLVTAHDEFESLSFDKLATNGMRVLVDGRNIYSPENVQNAGLRYIGVGR